MKRILFFTLCLVCFLSSGCLKKAKEDPLISFHSRKARMVGEWKASYFFYRIERKSSTTWYTYAITMKDGDYSVTYVDGSVTGSGKGKMKLNMTFDRKGNYARSEKIDGDLYETSGTWDFKSGVGEANRKSQIVMYIQSDSSNNGSFTWTGNYADIAYDITELRNKRVHLSYKVSSQNISQDETYTEQVEMILIPEEK